MAAPDRLDASAALAPEARALPSWAHEGGTVLAVTLLIGVSAQLAVPLPGTPVPVTLQDLAVFAVGIALGPTRGAMSVAAYVIAGALGAPVFSNGHAGLPWVMGPTGGFLLAFPIAAAVIGWASRSGKVWALPLGIVAAQAVMFTCGIGQLMLVTHAGVSTAVQQALLPFLPGVAFKSALLAVLGVALAAHRRGERTEK